MRVCGPKAGSKVVSVPRKGALSPPRPAALGCAKARWPPGELTLPLAERAVEEDLQTHTGERPESGEEWPRSQKGAAPAESSMPLPTRRRRVSAASRADCLRTAAEADGQVGTPHSSGCILYLKLGTLSTREEPSAGVNTGRAGDRQGAQKAPPIPTKAAG